MKWFFDEMDLEGTGGSYGCAKAASRSEKIARNTGSRLFSSGYCSRNEFGCGFDAKSSPEALKAHLVS